MGPFNHRPTEPFHVTCHTEGEGDGVGLRLPHLSPLAFINNNEMSSYLISIYGYICHLP